MLGYFIIAILIYIIGYCWLCKIYKKDIKTRLCFDDYMNEEKNTLLLFSVLWFISIPLTILCYSLKYLQKLIKNCFKIDD